MGISNDIRIKNKITEERYDLIADIPTFTEQGIDFVFPDLDYSFYFPPDTPDEAIEWYDNLVQEILADEEAQQAIADINVIPYYLSPEDSAANEEQMFEAISAVAEDVQ